MRTLALLLLLVVTPLIAGCDGSPAQAANVVQDAPPVPEANPMAPAAQHPWLEASPLRDLMRGMWMDCGIILSVAAKGGTQIDHERVECAAEDIVRKATRLADLWEAVLESSDACETAAKAGDWDTAWQHHGRIWKRCCDCHVATWTASRRGVTAESVDAWREGKPKGAEAIPPGGLRAGQQGPADPPVKKMMRALEKHTVAMRDALDKESVEAMAAPAAETRRMIQSNVTAFRKIAELARKLQQLAQGKASEDGREIYNQITGECSICHARSVTSPREFLSPPPWR